MKTTPILPLYFHLNGKWGDGVLKAWKNWNGIPFQKFRHATLEFKIRLCIKLFVGILPPQPPNGHARNTANLWKFKNFDRGILGEILRETKVFITNFCIKSIVSEINAKNADFVIFTYFLLFSIYVP